MALADYEAAWLELGEVVASREGWGAKALAAEMQKVLARHQIPEGHVERLLRLYGGRVSIVIETPEAPASDGNGSTPSPAAPVPGHRQTPGGHDGSRHLAGSAAG